MNILGETRILKDDRGVYKTTLVTTETNRETGEDETVFMKINVGFRKGVEVKHKTKINVKDGFVTFFRINTGEVYDDGNPIYKYYPKFVVMDFDVVEEGVDEVQQSRMTGKEEIDSKNNDIEDIIDDFYSSPDDDLPF